MSQKPFVLFDDTDTLDALRKLSDVEHLVLYCGAGATIDRTGSSWEELISLLVAKADGRGIEPAELEAVRRAVLASTGEEGGTIVWQTLADTSDNPHDSLDRALNSILYEQVGWSHGLLIDNIANLAIMATLGGKKVSIVTTNYDVYIEEGISDFLTNLGKSAKEMEKKDDEIKYGLPVPGLRYRAFRRPGARGPREIGRTVRRPVNTNATIDIIYIHGRIGRKFNEGGTHVVLTEGDYAITHDTAVSTLLDLLDTGAGLVVLGSSLRDKPLLEALVKSPCLTKYALVRLSTWLNSKGLTMESLGTQTKARGTAMKVLDRRGAGLGGLRIIGTENHEQISQFVEELRLAIEASVWDQIAWPVAEISYTTRLKTWHERWNDDRLSAEMEYQVVADFLETHQGASEYFDDGTRIEVWARASASPQDRRLHVVCCTSGPLLKTYVRRECSLADATVAAARGFNEGRPLILSLEDLGLSDKASRWQTFLTVPIFAGFSISFESGYFSAAPVGAVVVASVRSNPRFASLSSASKAMLISDLVDLGLSILRGDDMEDGDQVT